MRVLLTGASGFLGKTLLPLLVADERVTQILVTSRSKRSHPHPKVQVLELDLSCPAELMNLSAEIDAVIHLAGLYDFDQSYGSCYIQNVLPAHHLVQKLKELNRIRRVPLYFASSYAVGTERSSELSEAPLPQLPSLEVPYAYTKAAAEKAVTDAEIPSAIFRLGILVGNSLDGALDKADGPYQFVRIIQELGGSRLLRTLPKPLRYLPLPGIPEGILPLVPVDSAARVFHEALFQPTAAVASGKIYGVYDPSSVTVREFCDELLKRFLPGGRGIYLRSVPKSLLELQRVLSAVPADTFHFALHPIPLKNPAFKEQFRDCPIPAFKSYRESFFFGYHKFQEGRG